MTEKRNWVTIKPWLHLATPDSHVPITSLLPLEGMNFTAHLDGLEMTDSDGVFQQFWDGFKLPDYFGWNLPALRDCLRDLKWLTADQYTLIVDNFHETLAGEPEGLHDFLSVLLKTGAEWMYVKRPEGDSVARFHIILMTDREHVTETERLLSNLTD